MNNTINTKSSNAVSGDGKNKDSMSFLVNNFNEKTRNAVRAEKLSKEQERKFQRKIKTVRESI